MWTGAGIYEKSGKVGQIQANPVSVKYPLKSKVNRACEMAGYLFKNLFKNRLLVKRYRRRFVLAANLMAFASLACSS
jgi:hypothetical protein